MDNKNLQITNHDFLIYRDSNNDVKVSVMLINNDINKFVIKNSIYIVNGSPNDPQCTFSLYL